MELNGKIRAKHLSRTGYVYIRQSTTYQVMANTESTMRQYALKERMTALGWDSSLVKVIDSDLGISGTKADNREGFQKLMADVANGLVGAVACIEASRLSRSSSDWMRLIEICTMTDTLIIDSDGIYDPNDFNDRILLGMKGTMSEAEIHFLQERMRGGLLNKAKRGELCSFLPIGYDFDPDGRVIKTLNTEIREAVDQLFRQFRMIRTAKGVSTYYHDHDMKFPVRRRNRGHSGEIIWQKLSPERVTAILHNPFYTGVYTFGRTQVQWTAGGKRRPVPMPEEKWHANIPDHHEAYISKEEYEENLAILDQNRTQFRSDGSRVTPPREGNTLLQGICYCGLCGYQMGIQYSYRPKTGTMRARYICRSENLTHKPCRNAVVSGNVDDVISDLIKEKLSPEAMEITEQIQKEVSQRRNEHNRYFELKVEAARYEADRARAQYMSVDPSNRLVAFELERNWNLKLRALEEAEQRCQEEVSKNTLPDEKSLLDAVRNISENFDTVWDGSTISNEDRKRIARYVIRDVTITRVENYVARLDVVFQGGATATVYADVPKARHILIRTPDDVIAFLEKEAGHHNYRELTAMLNEQGFKRECGRPFTHKNVHRIMKDYGIRSMKDRYLDRGWLTLDEAAKKIGISSPALRYRLSRGKYDGMYIQVEKRNTILFDPDFITPACSDESFCPPRTSEDRTGS